MKHFLISLFSVALLSLPATALANHGHGKHEASHAGKHQCDSHKSCPLGKHDCGKHHKLASMDTDNDGKVSKKEYLSGKAARAQKKFKYLDANGDGFITDADHKARKAKRADDFFAAADSDGNGSLSKAEFNAAKKHGGKGKKACPLSDKK
ncbi:MAG: EF-hand domain-containing protein [Mariprofundus sp.]